MHAYTHTHTHRNYTHAQAYTTDMHTLHKLHAHTLHTHTPQIKAKPMAAITQPVNQHWDAWHHSWTQAMRDKSSWGRDSNQSEVSQIKTMEPEVPQQPHTTKQDNDSWP